MAEYVDVPIGDGVLLTVEVPPNSEPMVVEVGRARDISDDALATFGAAISSVRAAAAAVISQARDMCHSPSEVNVEFSIQLAASAGVVIASTAATANMRVAFKWTGLDDE